MKSGQDGFTLVELLIVMAVAAILLLATVPSFVSLFVRMRIEGTSNELSADLQNARSESIRRRAAVVLTSNADGAGYTIVSGTTTLKAVTFATGISITPSVSVTYDAMRAMANAAELTMSASGSTAQLRVKTNVMGRVEMCSPGHTINGYPAC
jgi:prepilin-type N-terminal cleavage/methylation domain-containing protein